VRHQFTTIPGLREDVVELLLNVKQIRIKMLQDIDKPVKLTLQTTGPGAVKAGDIKCSPEVQIVNKDLVLGHLADKKSKLKMEMEVEKGWGYQLAKEKKTKTIGVIPLDASFTPVVRVAYRVEATRVGHRTDLDKLVLQIWTDGTIDPLKAVKKAAKILVCHFKQIYEPTIKKEEKAKERETLPLDVANIAVEEILPPRIANALNKAGFKYLKDFVGVKREDILKIKNLGQKSLELIEKQLKKKGINLE
jgi:DNA-directed RNA polymerase subunit alpha